MAASNGSSDKQNEERIASTYKVPGFFIVTAWHWVLGLAALSAVTATLLALLMGLGVIANPLKRHVKTVIEEITPPDDGSLVAAKKANKRLERRLASLRAQIKDKRENCPVVERVVPERQAGMSKEEICRLCRERKTLLKGTMSISLLWQGVADMDLHLFCPNGDHVYFSSKSKPSCDAQLNHDMNIKGESSGPIENITLGKNAPAGTYRVAVQFYSKRRETRNAVPVTVNITGVPGQSGKHEKIARFPDHKKPNFLDIATFTLDPNRNQKPDANDGFNLDCSICRP